MRIRLAFEDPLPRYKCWFEVPSSCSTIRDLQKAIRKGFKLDQYCKTTRLDLDGFFLLPASTIAGLIKDDDLLQVRIRRKCDNLPPRSLPAAGGKKRSIEEAELLYQDSKTAKRRAHMGKEVPTRKSSQSIRPRPGQPNQKQKQHTELNRKPSTLVNSQAVNDKQEKIDDQQRTQSDEVTLSIKGNEAKKPATPFNQKKPEKTINSLNNKKVQNISAKPKNGTSEADSSASEGDVSDDTDSNNTVKPLVKVVPGSGSKQTKARNARRKLQKVLAASAQATTNSHSLHDVQSQDRESIQTTVCTPSRPTVSSNVHTQPSPKIVMTTVDLQDHDIIHKKQKATTPKKNVSFGKKAAGDAHGMSDPVPTQTILKSNTPNNASSIMPAKEDEADLELPLRIYADLPRQEGPLCIGDIIAYKTLEIGPSYNPIISEFKEATVIGLSESGTVAEVQLDRRFRASFEVDGDGQPILGKFDVYDEDAVERARQGIASLDVLSLADCRLISRSKVDS
ncbi:hypothetical protein BX616_000132 [Lobosporangium transversale]|uniref:Coilin N-terminal domain-containing protein n=1 Tax=Lobosporangium transversale TaxID=64571 RepID=A0A1Y2GEF1_9FUNG|nr:hypothetical protein BCR41DRAFT_360559 [Lobosporangium transversale]KAF9917721.1 hypothetical protein BX616_000132 [Lobosporangium transversale]ORZ07064.1 hypothetical protein BCR41DRAFT_360559 [Lobosporangium transversale]|eukprot:XP_021877860.1 hypothetical protein BCR41DRAFT_360559 [Lobosporangium transversale]